MPSLIGALQAHLEGYGFDLQNPEEVMRGEKPIVKEVRISKLDQLEHISCRCLYIFEASHPIFPDWALYLQSGDNKGQCEHEQWRIEPKIWGGWKDSHLQTKVRLVKVLGRVVGAFENSFLP